MGSLSRGYTFGATETVTNAKLHALVDDASIAGISNTDIASDAAIADTKLADISTGGKVNTSAITGTSGLGISYGGTGQTSKAPAFDALSPSTTQGDLIYHNGTNNARLAAGTDGYSLCANGAGANPAWEQVGVSGISGAFGTWADKSSGYAAQQATTDLFVFAYASISNTQYIYGYSDGNNPPVTIRAKVVASSDGAAGTVDYIFFPVKKNDYWKVETTGSSVTVYALPVGS